MGKTFSVQMVATLFRVLFLKNVKTFSILSASFLIIYFVLTYCNDPIEASKCNSNNVEKL